MRNGKFSCDFCKAVETNYKLYTYPRNDASIKTRQMCIILDDFFFDHPDDKKMGRLKLDWTENKMN